MGNCNFLGQVKWRENYYRVKVPVEPRWGGGGGGTPDFKSREWSNDRIQTKPKKFPGPKANPQKMPWRISKPSKFPESRRGYNTQQKRQPRYAGTTTIPRILRLFWISKKSLLKSSHPKQYLPNFCYPKQNLGIENFKTPPKIVQSSPSLELRCTPPPPPHSHTHLLGVKQNLFKGHFT